MPSSLILFHVPAGPRTRGAAVSLRDVDTEYFKAVEATLPTAGVRIATRDAAPPTAAAPDFVLRTTCFGRPDMHFVEETEAVAHRRFFGSRCPVVGFLAGDELGPAASPDFVGGELAGRYQTQGYTTVLGVRTDLDAPAPECPDVVGRVKGVFSPVSHQSLGGHGHAVRRVDRAPTFSDRVAAPPDRRQRAPDRRDRVARPRPARLRSRRDRTSRDRNPTGAAASTITPTILDASPRPPGAR